MGSAAEDGLGIILEKTDGHAPIAKIVEFGEFGVTRNDIDVTSHDSSGNAEEFIAGMLQAGELTIGCNLISGDTSGQMIAITECLSGLTNNWTIRLPNTDLSTFQFWGYCKGYKIKDDTKGFPEFSGF